MLVQCPECATKYNLDENKLEHTGSKVRCMRCQHVFTAFRPMPLFEDLIEDEETPSSVPEPAAAEAEFTPPRSVPSTPISEPSDEEMELDRLFSQEQAKQPAPADPVDKDMLADLEGAFQQSLLDAQDGDDHAEGGKSKSKAPLFVLAALAAVLCALLVAVYFLKPDLLGLPSRGVEPPTHSGAAVAEGVAQIALENVRQYFVPNEKEGQLFIIEGKAVNNFSEPRDQIRLKASLFNQQGDEVMSQEFVCGNVVSLYQLQVSSRQSIEEELAAKVGILTHNTNVQPGASVPFMVVFFKAPDSVEEFGLEVVQSSKP